MGRISGAFGIKGWVRVQSYTRPKANLLGYSPWLVTPRSGEELRLEVVDGKDAANGMLVQLAGIDDRDRALALGGATVAVERSQLPAAAPGEVYWADLIGLRVENLAGRELGKVINLIETGANDVLVIRDADGEDTLVPFVREIYVKSVVLGGGDGLIRVDWLED